MKNAPPPVPPPVGGMHLAFKSDHCLRCRRAINVNEPVFRGSVPGSVHCSGCNDALNSAITPPATPRAAPGDMVTSMLLRYTAQLLKTGDVLRVSPNELRIIAHELQMRSSAIESVAAGARHRCDPVHRMGCACDVLQAIGEGRKS